MDEALPRPLPDRPSLGWLVPLASLAALLAVVAGCYRSFVPDDLFIYLRFVDNLLHGAGPSFNPGEPTYGFTSALWYGILALGSRLTGELLAPARTLSLACALLALPIMERLTRRLSGSVPLAAAASVLLGLDAWFTRWAATGMETSCAVVLLLAAFARHLREVEEDRSRIVSVVLFGLLALVRPEALALMLLAVGEAAWAGWERRGRGGWRRAAGAGAAAAATVGPWLLYAARRFGTLLPDTASAKAPGAFVDRAWASLLRSGKLAAVSVGLPLLVLVVAALAYVLRGRRAPGPGLRRSHLLLLAWLVTLPVLYAASGVTAYSRYLLLWTPLVLAAGLAAGAWLFRRRRALLVAVVVLTAAQNLWASVWILGPASQQYARSLEEVGVGLGRWLGEHTAPDAVIAAENIGAIGLYSGRRILDMNGLITPAIIPYKRRGQVERYLEEHPPDYAIKIAPQPDPWKEGGPHLSLELLDVRRYDKMFVTQEGPLYYSLYRVGPPAARRPQPGVVR